MYVIYILLVVLVVALLIYYRPTKQMSEAYANAEEETRFATTFFLIYDNSTPDLCDRLIKVMPFEWLIWAINGDVYIIETATGTMCQKGTTAAMKVTTDIFTMVSTCLSVTMQTILNLYRDPIRVNYDVSVSSVRNTFTILDALNMLFKEYIRMDDSNQIEDVLSVIGIRNIPQIYKKNVKHLLPKKTITTTQQDELFRRVHTIQ
jgi:hypothetical protein